MDDQREIIAFLSSGESYGRPDIVVERIETHISFIFLVADRAYKLKRAVRFSYLDYSTPALRERYCRKEFALNRRTAPTLYLGLRAITRESAGGLTFDGPGVRLEWVLEMRRFAQDDQFDRLAEAGKLTPGLMRDLTDAIATFHRTAEISFRHGGQRGIEQTIVDNNLNLIAACPPSDRDQVEEWHAGAMAKLAAVASLLEKRRDGGKVRRCHGDLHLGNISLINNQPTLFDCIEFSDALSLIDVLYDLAFLLMDLEHRELGDLASVVFNRYLDLTGDIDGMAAIPLFMSMRAAIRAHVLAARARQDPAAQAREAARSYLSLAVGVLGRYSPRLIAIGGLSGAGKSTVARALASDFRPAPGARVIRSDVVRKRLFDVAPETRLPPAAYVKETTERVYRDLCDQAAGALAAGYTAIVDAVFLREEERQAIGALADRARVPFFGIWLEAPAEMLAARLDARREDASDADRAVLRRQLELSAGEIGWQRIDGQEGLAAVLAAVRIVLAARIPGLGRASK